MTRSEGEKYLSLCPKHTPPFGACFPATGIQKVKLGDFDFMTVNELIRLIPSETFRGIGWFSRLKC